MISVHVQFSAMSPIMSVRPVLMFSGKRQNTYVSVMGLVPLTN